MIGASEVSWLERQSVTDSVVFGDSEVICRPGFQRRNRCEQGVDDRCQRGQLVGEAISGWSGLDISSLVKGCLGVSSAPSPLKPAQRCFGVSSAPVPPFAVRPRAPWSCLGAHAGMIMVGSWDGTMAG